MTRRLNLSIRYVAVLAIVFCSLVGAFSDAQEKAIPTAPNVLFIAIDDLNHWGIGGRPGVHTPNIDRLAERGVLFANAHCAAPACNPSRVSVLTGVRPSTSGVYLNGQDWRISENLKEVATLPQHFREHGYTTLGGGKIYHSASLSEKGYTGLLDPKP
tara:strand:- start:185 stop:658 length:474 start_codon:yes stop_codon:yes gene_type:complete